MKRKDTKLNHLALPGQDNEQVLGTYLGYSNEKVEELTQLGLLVRDPRRAGAAVTAPAAVDGQRWERPSDPWIKIVSRLLRCVV